MATKEPAGKNAKDGSRGPGRPRDARHDRVILEATLEIMQEQGYRGVTIEGVAARAGVGRPTIYRRWPSKPALVVAALVESPRLALPAPNTGSLRRDLIAVQRHQVELMSTPDTRRVTAGLIADLADDPELADTYVSQYVVPRRATVWQVLQRGVERGELAADVDLAFLYDLLVGPLFMRAVVWGQPLPPDAAEQTADVILTAFAPNASEPHTERRTKTTHGPQASST